MQVPLQHPVPVDFPLPGAGGIAAIEALTANGAKDDPATVDQEDQAHEASKPQCGCHAQADGLQQAHSDPSSQNNPSTTAPSVAMFNDCACSLVIPTQCCTVATRSVG